MGQPTWVYSPGDHSHGLRLRYHRPSTTHAFASGCLGFFAHMGNFESLHCLPKWWITFRIALYHQRFQPFHQHFLHGDFRIVLSFMFSCPPPATFPHRNFWDPARHCIGWARQEVVYCFTTGIFSHFLFLFLFLLTPSFAARSPHSPLLANRHGHLLPRGPTRPTHTPYTATMTLSRTLSMAYASSTSTRPPSTASTASTSPPLVSPSCILCAHVPDDTFPHSRHLHKTYMPCSGRVRVDAHTSHSRTTGHPCSNSLISIACVPQTWAAWVSGSSGARNLMTGVMG